MLANCIYILIQIVIRFYPKYYGLADGLGIFQSNSRSKTLSSPLQLSYDLSKLVSPPSHSIFCDQDMRMFFPWVAESLQRDV